jgi:hypothetical protein
MGQGNPSKASQITLTPMTLLIEGYYTLVATPGRLSTGYFYTYWQL